MILCPNCLHKEMMGALFCSECGAQLIQANGVPTNAIQPPSAPLDSIPTKEWETSPKAATKQPSGAVISLRILSSGETIDLNDHTEVILGRTSKNQQVVPDIDLTAYKAFEAGVSRMHAAIKVEGSHVTVIDLASANGTRINGQLIEAHTPQPLMSGDILMLGKLKIQVMIHDSSIGG